MEFPEFREFLIIPSNTRQLMKTNTLEDFKKAIKEKYENEKGGSHAHFLLQLSRAKLRDLCFELFQENSNLDDLNCYRAFLGFEFDKNGSNKVKALTDKFRPLETFLKGETDLTDLAAVNMVAILVGLTNRPYLKFVKMEVGESDFKNEIPILKMEKESIIVKRHNEDYALQFQNTEVKKHLLLKKPYLFIIPVLLILISIFGYQKWNQKECMQWTNDHYEAVDCKTAQATLFQSTQKVAINETVLSLRKISVCDTTVFFSNEKPQIWYCKKGKEIEFFNGPGFHPENGKVLKPITTYMIDKYVLNKNPN